MKRFLVLAPAAALAFLAFATPASAQTTDPDLRAEITALRQEAHRNHSTVSRLQRLAERCEPLDEAEILAAAESSNALSRHAAGLAWRVPGRDHVTALNVQTVAEADFWHLITLGPAEICYQPS